MNKGKRIFAVAVALLLAAVLISSAAFLCSAISEKICAADPAKAATRSFSS